jgi:hypothetical protein
MSTAVDLSRTSGLIDLGTHSFQITERSWEDEGPSGDPCWYVVCKVVSAGDNQGKELLHTVSLGPKSRWKMDEFLDGIGAPKRGKYTLEQCVGKKFRASVGAGTYQGKPKSTIESFIPIEAGQESFAELVSEVVHHDEALPEDVLGEPEPAAETEQAAGRRGRF